MDRIAWNSSYIMGVDFLDQEHKALFSTMNKLLRLSESEEKSGWVCQEGAKYLKNHTLEHFEHEEEYMRSIDYSEYETHKRLHDNFRTITLPALEKELENSGYSLESIRHFLGVCIGWVVAHTQTEDLAIAGKQKSIWADIPHVKEKEALEQVITQLIDDLFHFRAKLISEQYAGEDFGEVVCCRFIYSGQQKEKWEITFVYEKHLLLKIISDLLNTQYLRVDDMVINITRYISRQFLERIRENFPSMDLYKVEKESLLSYEQLLDSFNRSNPSCSLLFDTGNGYLAFCANSSESIRGKLVRNINPDNVMLAVNEFLNREKTVRGDILVVDDSEFMRARIVKLLSGDYNVSEASSSLAAIQSIAIKKPDLIVLDYEMPVCDGRQALEMIRSEQNTANIPVVFLTAKGSRERVQNVMALKPNGYLLKSMPDEEIKKYIDTLFANKKEK
ncbi:MAG: response regulator [Lachnospiraceae bacterium]|nr:response regulator [Lachnospiraceae bacterium]